MQAGRNPALPDELIQTQQWLHEVFYQAGRGLPWPQQLGLALVERLITLGMVGSLMASAWLVQDAQTQAGTVRPGMDVAPVLAALEAIAWGSVSPELRAGLQAIARSGDGVRDLERFLVAIIGPGPGSKADRV